MPPGSEMRAMEDRDRSPQLPHYQAESFERLDSADARPSTAWEPYQILAERLRMWHSD